MQVTNMLTIFLKASEVVTWMGVGSPDTAEAMKNLSDGRDSRDTSPKFDFDGLFQTQFFRRVWIKQEVFAAVKLYVQCGFDRLPWEALELQHFMRRTLEIRSDIEAGEEQNFYLWELGRGGKRTDIVNVLRLTAGSKASDSRDFVYGVLGMSRTILKNNLESEQNATSLPVDYKRNVAQVFGDVARYLMRRDGCLNVLLLDGDFGVTVDGYRLPSWVPDWRKYTYQDPWLTHAKYKSGSPGWRFNEYTGCADEECPFVEQENDMILRVKGLILGRINATDSEELEGSRHVWQLNDADGTAEKLLRRDQFKMLERKYPATLRNFKDLVNRELLKHAEKDPKDWPKKGRPLEIPLFGESEPDGFDSSISILIPAKRVSLRKIQLRVTGYSELLEEIYNDYLPPRPKPAKIVEISVGNVRSKRAVDRIGRSMGHAHESDFRKQTTLEIPRGGRLGLWPLLENNRPEYLIPLHWVVPKSAKVNDVVVFLRGGILPMVFRPVPGDSSYQLVGPAALTHLAFEDQGVLVGQIDHFLWTNCEDQYLFLLRLLDFHQRNGTLETFDLV